MKITECAGYKKLLASVEKDAAPGKKYHDYRGKLEWVLERAKHYAEKTGLAASDILDAWEAARGYWYMNYYQDCNQPVITGDSVRVFDTLDALKGSIGDKGFRCPACGGVSTDAYSGKEMGKGKVCDWKVYGLFGALGKGIYVFVKSETKGQTVFMPVAWEDEPLAA